MRDHLHKIETDLERKSKQIRLSRYYEELADTYSRLFMNLRDEIKKFNLEGEKFQGLNEMNYAVDHNGFVKGLGTNLVNTEVDIVLESKEFLFIGEAKSETSLVGTSSRVLVHQLIRQYVMAKILMEHRSNRNLSPTKETVPFMVRREPEGREQLQVKFMLDQKWLRPGNVLTWEQVAELTGRV